MNASHLAQLTLEVWRASGARTEERRTALLHDYARSYYGADWALVPAIAELVAEAHQLLRRSTRIDELQYRGAL